MWDKYSVGDLCETISDTYHRHDENVILINTSDVLEGKVKNHQKVKNINIKGQFKKTFRKNDILYSEIRPANKRYAFIDFDDTEQYIASTKLMVLRAKEQIVLPRFLLAFLSSKPIIAKLQQLAETRSGTFPQITFSSEIAPLPILVPDLKTQEYIIDFLGCFDDKIEVNNKIIKNLEKQLVCLFDEKCKTKGQLSSSVVQSLSDIATFTNGLAMQKFPPESDGQFLRVLKIKELRQGYLDESSDKCSTNIEEKFKVNDGDVIFSWSGSLMVDLWTGGVCGLNQHLFKVTSDLYPKWFVYMWVKHHVSDFAAIAAAKATTMGHIKRGDLDKAQVVVPNDECMKTLTKIFDPLLGLLIATKIQNKKLSKIRDMLLPKLISGEIELKNQ